MSQEPARFLTGNLTQHILIMSLTSAVGLVSLFIVDLVDMIFISMLGIEELAAAVGFAGIIMFGTTSISIGMAIAGGALVAKSLGQNDSKKATELLTNVLLVGVAFAVVFATTIFFNLDSLTALIGAKGHTQELAITYLRILVPTMPVLLIGIIASAALRSHGAARLSMMVTLTGGVVNAIFDPIFIFVLDMGLEGAAWASVLSRFSLAATACWYIVRRYGGFSEPSWRMIVRDLSPIAAIAVPAMLTNIAAPIGGAYITRAAADFGEAAVAGMAVIGRVTPVAFALIFAMSAAIGPIIGQNFGAGQHLRVRTTYNRSMVLIVAYVVPVVVILFLLRGSIADLFNAEGEARDLIYLFCGPLSLAWIFNGIIFVGNAAYNNLGHPFYSTWINWGRNTLGTVPFVYFGAQIWGAGGVLIGQMAGGLFAAAISFLLAENLLRKAAKNQILEPVAPVEPEFTEHQREFGIEHNRH